MQLASGITGLGAAASNTALTQYGGTFDINGNSVNIGGFNGGPAAIIDNNGRHRDADDWRGERRQHLHRHDQEYWRGDVADQNRSGAIVLGDVNGMSSLAFTGNLTVNTQGAAGANVLTLAVPFGGHCRREDQPRIFHGFDLVQIKPEMRGRHHTGC